MDKVLYTDFIGVDELVGELLEQKEFKRAITRSNLYKFWKQAAGENFANRSRPYSMLPGNIMVVACENAIIAQELLLNKARILAKFQPYAKSLKMEVKDLKFDPKRWSEEF